MNKKNSRGKIGKIKLRSFIEKELVLICPHCGKKSLRFTQMDIFQREENSQVGLLHGISVNGLIVHATDTLKDNLGHIGNAIVIQFWCRGCKEFSSITIQEHKNKISTYVKI